MYSKCENCGKEWGEDKLKDVQDFFERVHPDEPCPSGECPDCGSLCHYADGASFRNALVREVYRTIRDSQDLYAAPAADLFYLLGAILTDGEVELSPDEPAVKYLREIFAPDHDVWKFIKLEY